MKLRNLTLLTALLATISASLVDCTDPPVNTDALGTNQPAGIIQGSVLYSGPPPCTKNGKIIGSAEVLLFNVNMLPPPEGLGTSAANLDVIPAEVMFKSIASKLHYNKDGSLYCADANETITVSTPFSIAPIPAGQYQIRGFFDRDNDFQPVFKIRNLPTAGDIGGGAVDNAAEVVAGAAPQYTVFDIGKRDKKTGKWVMPEEGFLFQGAAVSFGVKIPMNRPYFHFKSAKIESAWSEDASKKGKPQTLDAHNLQMPSDFRLNVFSAVNPVQTDASLLKLVVGAGPADDELADARRNPFFMHVSEDPKKNMLLFMGSDSNFDGEICYSGCKGKPDTIPDSDLIPALDPLAIFSKLDDTDKTLQKAQTAPVVIIQNITLYDGGLIETIGGPSAIDAAHGVVPASDITLAVRPVAICIPHPEDPNSTAIAVTPWQKDGAENDIIADPDAVKAGISTSLGRPVEIRYGCLPEGKYALSLIYSATGQAWTVPNEAGVCMPTEPPTKGPGGKTICNAGSGGKRLLLPSQGEFLTITKPETGHCKELPVPAECLPH